MIFRGFALSMLLLLGAPILWAAPADDIYRRGIEAIDGRDWQTAADAMAEAIELRPDAGGSRVKIYGMRFEDYTPYLHLGNALSRLDRCAEALDAWAQAESQGILTQSARRDLEDRKQRCRRGLPTPRNNTPPPAGEPPTADESWAGSPPPEVLRRAAADFLAHRYGQALDQLDSFQTTDPLAGSTAHLLRAACRFGLYRMGGAQDSALLSTIKRDISAGRELSPTLSPSAFWFSPAFRRLFNDVTTDP